MIARKSWREHNIEAAAAVCMMVNGTLKQASLLYRDVRATVTMLAGYFLACAYSFCTSAVQTGRCAPQVVKVCECRCLLSTMWLFKQVDLPLINTL